ncbi:MAG TPA: hypothetical protein VI074_06905 [Propionibacteriaceae bacterium]
MGFSTSVEEAERCLSPQVHVRLFEACESLAAECHGDIWARRPDEPLRQRVVDGWIMTYRCPIAEDYTEERENMSLWIEELTPAQGPGLLPL